jgi:RNA polymerase sigma-70 factor (ECF subfamily)
MDDQKLIPHLFRSEFRKIATVLTRLFGAANMDVAEDITSETFLLALETWPFKGIPENPTAWLYTVAKNKAKNHLRRNQVFHEKIIVEVKLSPYSGSEEPEIDLSEKNITDSQLQMLFAVCHPSLTPEAQIALSLRMLCGFGIEEIANAFLSNKETINKRLFRAKEKLREEKIQIEFPPDADIKNRIETVLRTLYLLFNEGYYSESQDSVLREDLCLEAMRLNYLLLENEHTNKPEVNALFSLMCFHASRFPARKNENGEIVLYDDQDETLWVQALIEKGAYYLNQAARGERVSKYHLEAGIAYWHTIKSDTKEKWENILQLYNKLLKIEYSPIAALNRTFALSKANGKREAIIEAEKLKLVDNHYYYVLLGELYRGTDNGKAKTYFEKAYTLARTQADKHTILKKIRQPELL